jgi:putative transposase
VIHRGLERRRLFKSAADVDRVVGAHADLPSRFAVRVYAYVLLPKHYHLLIQTPQANLSQALQWLNVSDSVWFKRQHRRVGPLFQGRFKAILVAPDGPLLQVSRHLHRKPVRTRRFYAARIRPQKGDEASRHERGAPPARLGRSS